MKIQNPKFPGEGYNPNQKTVILMWNPDISSVTMEYHQYCITHYDTELFNWSVYEWEKVHEGDRFYLIRVGEGNTGVVMSGIFSSEPYTSEDWNKKRNSRDIHYMDMLPNFIVNPESLPIITTSHLQETIPDFEWAKGHSGSVLNDKQAQTLEALFAPYLESMEDEYDDTNVALIEWKME